MLVRATGPLLPSLKIDTLTRQKRGVSTQCLVHQRQAGLNACGLWMRLQPVTQSAVQAGLPTRTGFFERFKNISVQADVHMCFGLGKRRSSALGLQHLPGSTLSEQIAKHVGRRAGIGKPRIGRFGRILVQQFRIGCAWHGVSFLFDLHGAG